MTVAVLPWSRDQNLGTLHAFMTTGVLQTSSSAYLFLLNLCPFSRPAQQHAAVAPGLDWSRGPGHSVVSASCHLLWASTASPGPPLSLRNATSSPNLQHAGTIQHSLNCPQLSPQDLHELQLALLFSPAADRHAQPLWGSCWMHQAFLPRLPHYIAQEGITFSRSFRSFVP